MASPQRAAITSLRQQALREIKPLLKLRELRGLIVEGTLRVLQGGSVLVQPTIEVGEL